MNKNLSTRQKSSTSGNVLVCGWWQQPSRHPDSAPILSAPRDSELHDTPVQDATGAHVITVVKSGVEVGFARHLLMVSRSAQLNPVGAAGNGELPGVHGWLTGVDPPPVGGFHFIPELAVSVLAYLVGRLGSDA